jgi:hypothetical protein
LTTSPRAGSSSTTSPTPRVRVPRHVARLVTRLFVDYFASRRLVVDYFAYAARSGATTRRAARRRLLRLAKARRRLLRLRCASGCLGKSRDSSCGSSSTTSSTPRDQVPRLVALLVAPLVVDYSTSRRLVIDNFAYAARPGASARCAARHAARRRLLRLRHASGCLGMSRGSSSTPSTMPRVQVPWHVVRLVAPLVVDYSTSHRFVVDYSASHRLVVDYFASACRGARHVARRRQLHLRHASECLGTSRRLFVDYFASAARPGASARRAAHHAA